jgi:hypothetical protein
LSNGHHCEITVFEATVGHYGKDFHAVQDLRNPVAGDYYIWKRRHTTSDGRKLCAAAFGRRFSQADKYEVAVQ